MQDATYKKRLHTNRIVAIIVMAVLFALFTVGTVMFFRYVSGQLYKESVNQLTEICSQLFERLYSQLDVQWQYLDNLSAELIASDDYDEATLSHMLFSRNRMFAPQNDGTLFLALTENGYFYDETGRQGLWSGMDKLDARSRQSHVVSQWLSNDNYMAFVRQIQGNVAVGGENITHVVLLKPIAKMAPYFTSGAFKNKNATYVVDYDGNKMFGDESGVDVNFYGSNLFRALEKLGYPHEKNFGDFLQKSGTDGFVCTDVVADRHHFYLGLKQLQDYDWTMLFLVSADVVATSTRSMTMSMTGIFFVVLSVFVFLSILALCIFSKLNKSKQLLSLKTQTNEQLEQLNEQLTLARRETETALQKANEANKAKSVFLASVSHNIRTPMNAIIGISDIMAHQSELSAKTQFYVKKLQLSGRHLLGLINDILDMSKIEANEVTLKPEPLCWGDQMRQVVGIIRERAEIRKQNFFVHTHNLVHENVIGDGLRLRKVIINLLSNAVKYTDEGGTIDFDLTELSSNHPEKARFELTVSDTGIGMSEEFIARIFQPFSRADDGKTKMQGTGLGMSITKNIVDLMDGTINIDSHPGKGTKIVVTLDLPTDKSASAKIGTERVLVVTRNKFTEQAIVSALSASDAEVVVVRSAKAAMERLRGEQRKTAVLLDGFERNSKLKSIAKDIKNAASGTLVFCCGYGLNECREVCGIDGVITFPFFASSLVNAISSALSNDNGSARSAIFGMRFMCAEDNELNSEILQEILKINGASCVVYSDGKQIVEAFKRTKPGDFDAVLMDVQMPIMDGLKATELIRKIQPFGAIVPIIAMTANAFTEDVEACLNAGMNAHVSKPIEVSALERAIKETINQNKN